MILYRHIPGNKIGKTVYWLGLIVTYQAVLLLLLVIIYFKSHCVHIL